MVLIYELSIRLYCLIIKAVSPFNLKAKQWVEGRKDIFARLNSTIVKGERIAWFHSASLGEFEQGRPVIEEYKQRNPDVKVLLTFFSPSGYEIRKNYAGADYIFYLPADTHRNAIRFIELVKPEIVFFIKYEFWYNYLNELQKRNIPTYLFSAIFRPNQVFFKNYGEMFRKVLSGFNHIFVQNAQSVELLKAINIEHVTIAGDTRFDRVATIASQTRELPIAKAFCNNQTIFIAGSTWPADEELLAQYINQSPLAFKTIIAPHEIEPAHIDQLEARITKKVLRYSQAEKHNPADFDVLIIDNIGMLSSLYQYGNVSYIGGGFGKGIHNTLEAATFGLPVIFGSNYLKFAEACELIERGAAFTISTYAELNEQLNWFFENANQCIRIGGISADYVKEKTGATNIILNNIEGKR